jgi:hypothetical protein
MDVEKAKSELEFLQLEHPLLLQQLKKEQQLELKHLAKTQLVEKIQQEELLALDRRIAISEYKKIEKENIKRLFRTFKAFKAESHKKLPPEEIKQRITAMKLKSEDDEEKREFCFYQKITEEEEQEKESLRVAHEAQLERSSIVAEEAIQSLMNQHHQKVSAHEETERQRLQEAENKYWTGVYDAILTHQDNYTILCERHHKEQIESLTQLHQEELRLLETEKHEIEDLCKEQGRPEFEEDFLAVISEIEQQILQSHDIQMKDLKAVHNEDVITLKREQKRYRQEVKRTAPDTILYVYAKTKQKERKKKILEFPNSDQRRPSSILSSSSSGPLRSSSSMMKKKKVKSPPQ